MTLSAGLGHMQTLFDMEETYLKYGMAIPSLHASETMQTDPYDPGRGPEESRSGLSLIRIDLDQRWRHFGWWELGERCKRGITVLLGLARPATFLLGLARSSMAIVSSTIPERERTTPRMRHSYRAVGTDESDEVQTALSTWAKTGAALHRKCLRHRLAKTSPYICSVGQNLWFVDQHKRQSRIMADGRSAIYSGPYRSPVLKDYGSDRMTPALECGNEWKTHRRLFHLSIRSDVVDKYNDLYLDHARRLSQNILDDSTKLFEHVDLYTGAILVQLIYGQRVEGKDDLIFAMTNGLAELMTKELTAHKLGLLTVMPFLRYLPSWFPGAGFKRKAASVMGEWRSRLRRPQLAVSIYMFKTRFTQNWTPSVGRETRSTFADRPQLPYLQAVLYEVLRWNPPAPLGPSDSLLWDYGVVNYWCISYHMGLLRDAKNQLDRIIQSFTDLERACDEAVRVCPGHFFADHSIWAATAVLLSTLKFGKAKDSSGKYIEVEPLFANGLVR
ncbi:cytochrome P450 [Pisolithus sp. B1]|nr:cytochrome P450 [Pisolithus sp. B1]